MSVLGFPQPGNPKSMTQLAATSPQRTCLIGICKDMMSSMDPSREAGLQDERKNTKCKPWLQNTGALGKGLSPTFYSRKGPYWRTTHDATVAALTSAIMQILHIVQSHVSVE